MRDLAYCLGGTLVVAVLGCDARSAGLDKQSATAGQMTGSAGTAASGGRSEGSGGSPETAQENIADPPRSGTRLKARVIEAESGAFQFLGWQDTVLDTQCTFPRPLFRELQCFPDGNDLAQIESTADTSLFADAECALPVRELSDTAELRCAPPRFARATTDCAPNPAYFRVGDHADALYRLVGADCQPVETPAPASLLSIGFFEVEPFAIEGFAEGTLSEGPEAGGIAPVYLSTEDGAQEFWNFRAAEDAYEEDYDTRDGFECELQVTVDGYRCLPINMPLAGFVFADADCGAPAALGMHCSQFSRTTTYTFDASHQMGIDSAWRVFEGGVLARLYAGVPDQCSEFDQQDSFGYTVGPEIPNERFILGARIEDRDEQGVIALVESAGGWSVRGRHGLRNANFGGYDCKPLTTGDGMTRCVPSPMFYEPQYADAGCTEALISGWDSTEAVSFMERQCPYQVTVFARGEEYSGPIYRKDGEQCVFDHEEPPQPARTIAHRLGAELPPASFPEISITLR